MSANNSDVATKEQTPPANAETIDNDTCVVCFKNVDIWSIGECDHPVCYECSTRMRVLCQQNECPICRQVLGKVIFTYEKLPYRELETKNRSEFYNKRYKIGFYTNDIQKRFFELLDHPCPKCNTLPYRSFQGLRDHVRREHNLHFCDLCVDNLKIFTFERRCYTQAELHLHRTKGDSDNKSHRGHPLCEYCNKRFLDRDELFRHLRREHYFCHFCDADGCNEFYKDYDALAEHFRQDHYLCEEGKCATEQFVGAFRTEIDYKAHVASVHGKLLNKQQAKQTRTLQLEITLGPRGRGGQTEQNIANMRSRGHDNSNEDLEPSPSYAQYQNQRSITIDSQNEQDFPSLGGGSSAPAQPLVPFQMRRGIAAGIARTKENFPALSGGGGGSTTQRAPQQQPQGPPISSMLKKNATPNNNNARTAGPTTTTTTNITTNSHNNNGSSMVIHVSNRPNVNGGAIAKKPQTSGMDFPALPSSSSSSATTTSKHFSNLSLTSKVKKPQQQHQHQQQQQQFVNNKQQHARLLEEDMVSSSNQNLPLNTVAAKHRILVDDYVSVANPKNFQKFQMVQQQEEAAKAAAAIASTKAPKLTSEEFPTLNVGFGDYYNQSNPTNGSVSANWSKSVQNERKQRELENRKAKIAPPPLAAVKNVQSNKNTTNASKENQNSAKEKKLKEKKNETTSNNQNQQNSTKTNQKLKEKNNNNETKTKTNPNAILKTTNNSDGSSLSNVDDSLRPPPGFLKNKTKDSSSNHQQQKQQQQQQPINALGQTNTPPPGFLSNVTVNSVAKSPNNLTFTSSLGESYSIVPPKHNYTEPPNSPKRNQKLVKDFQDAMNGYECFKEFHLISQKFREGLYKPEAFYEHCQVALKDKFDQLFPELLALLPDISKQQALYLVHAQRLNSMPVEQRKLLPQLMVCSVCGQIVLSKDTKAHETSHEFPSLKGGLEKLTTSGKRK